ncbi:MAG: hypothetical protein ACI8UO_005148 [Verrucomicrobiales bacterium]|jgi:hypothetical protein
MDITNKSGKPLSLPLPGGKKLFLGPGKTGQVTDKALKHPPIVKLLEAGDLETVEGSGKNKGGGAGMKGGSPSGASGHGGTGAMRQSGDR